MLQVEPFPYYLQVCGTTVKVDSLDQFAANIISEMERPRLLAAEVAAPLVE